MRKRFAAVVAAVLLVAGVGVGVVLARSDDGEESPVLAELEKHEHGVEQGGHELGRRPKEAVIEHRDSQHSIEAENASGQQVDNRAYPGHYVTSRQALAARRAYLSKPRKLSRSDFAPGGPNPASRAGITSSWEELGPVTPKVPAEGTYTGAGSLNSGRVQAMAIDPNCGQPGTDCRLWIGAAGGGIWRTDDALASKPTWQPKSAGLESFSNGSLVVDPNDPSGDTLYAGTGEPNGSTDSEAGVGLYKTTDGGEHWSLVPGSRAVSIDRSIGTIAIDPNNPDHIYIGTDLARHGHSSTYGGRRTPPHAPQLGLYQSPAGGATLRLIFSPPGRPHDPPARTG